MGKRVADMTEEEKETARAAARERRRRNPDAIQRHRDYQRERRKDPAVRERLRKRQQERAAAFRIVGGGVQRNASNSDLTPEKRRARAAQARARRHADPTVRHQQSERRGRLTALVRASGGAAAILARAAEADAAYLSWLASWPVEGS